jgi:hypothetical protein
MKILPSKSIDITTLIGALLINENGGEFYCTGIKLYLDSHTIWVDLSEEPDGEQYASISFEDLNNNSWSIQF